MPDKTGTLITNVCFSITVSSLDNQNLSYRVQQIFDWERGEQEETLKKPQLCFSLFELMDMSISI